MSWSFNNAPLPHGALRAAFAWSGGFSDGAAQDVLVVAEDGGDLDLTADGLDVAGDSLNGGYLAALDLGDAALGYAHLVGDLRLGQAQGLAPLGEPVPVDVGLVTLARLGNGLLATGLSDDAAADVLPPGKVSHRPSPSRSLRYSAYNSSACGIALRYQPCQSPDLSPPVIRIADRHWSNANNIRTSVRP